MSKSEQTYKDSPVVNIGAVKKEDGFVMPFVAKLKRVKLDAEGVVMPLLKEVREMVGRDVVPGGRKCLKSKTVKDYNRQYTTLAHQI